jgi:hypothetical protein
MSIQEWNPHRPRHKFTVTTDRFCECDDGCGVLLNDRQRTSGHVWEHMQMRPSSHGTPFSLPLSAQNECNERDRCCTTVEDSSGNYHDTGIPRDKILALKDLSIIKGRISLLIHLFNMSFHRSLVHISFTMFLCISRNNAECGTFCLQGQPVTIPIAYRWISVMAPAELNSIHDHSCTEIVASV